MKLPRNNRWRWGAGGVVTTLVIVVTAAAGQRDDDANDIVGLKPREPASAPATATESDPIGTIPLERLKRARMQVERVKAFSAKSWYVAPPPPPPAPPPAPTAPPLPFTFLGQIQEPTGKLTIFLAGENRVYLVSGGETIENTYHVDGVEDGKLALTYLPLQIKQYVTMGEAP